MKTFQLSNILNSFQTFNSKNATRPWRKGSQSTSFDFICLINHWPSLVGELLGKNTKPLKIAGGALIVLTRHSTFSHQLSFLQDTILEKIFKEFPFLKKSIKKIKFTTSTQAFSESQKTEVNTPKQKQSLVHPFSPQFREKKREAELFFGQIEDEEIKKLLISIYIQTEKEKVDNS